MFTSVSRGFSGHRNRNGFLYSRRPTCWTQTVVCRKQRLSCRDAFLTRVVIEIGTGPPSPASSRFRAGSLSNLSACEAGAGVAYFVGDRTPLLMRHLQKPVEGPNGLDVEIPVCGIPCIVPVWLSAQIAYQSSTSSRLVSRRRPYASSLYIAAPHDIP
jgi:hypothetical protein